MMTINGFVVAITIFLIQVFNQSFFIFIICIIFIILIVIYNIIITKSNVIIQEDYNNKHAKYNAISVDFIENIKVVKNYDALNYVLNKINSSFNLIKKPLKRICIYRSLRVDGINALIYTMYAILLISLFISMKMVMMFLVM